MENFDLVIRNGIVVTPVKTGAADLGVRDGKITAIGDLAAAKAAQTIDAKNLHILPGMIDTQVHFREPGLTHKEDLATGTKAAILGGVTGVFEMPNTNPLTLTRELLQDKLDRCVDRAYCHYAFFIGGSAANAESLAELENLPGCPGVKIFMGSSTGSLLVEDDANLLRIMQNGKKRIAVHAEDEPRLRERRHLAESAAHPRTHPVWRDEETALRATTRLLRAARAANNRPVHVLHVTTAQEMALLAQNRDIATVEVTPQHLTLTAPECYERLGTYAQMNPPIRDQAHQDALWRALGDGVVDMIGSDHAPHTHEEKHHPYPQSHSGMPGVQTTLPLMLHHVALGKLSLQKLVDLCAHNPARIYGIRGKGKIAIGMDADLVLVDLKRQALIENKNMAYKCGWTPFDGMRVTGWPVATVLNGTLVMQEGEVITPPMGQRIDFGR
jgi:dihydroorotase